MMTTHNLSKNQVKYTVRIRELAIDKLCKFEAVIFSNGKAKFFRIAALLSKILRQLVGKRISQMRRLLITKSLTLFLPFFHAISIVAWD